MSKPRSMLQNCVIVVDCLRDHSRPHDHRQRCERCLKLWAHAIHKDDVRCKKYVSLRKSYPNTRDDSCLIKISTLENEVAKSVSQNANKGIRHSDNFCLF